MRAYPSGTTRLRAVATALAAGATLAATAGPVVADPPPGGGETTPPRITIDLPASPGQGPWVGWYATPVPVTVSATDAAGLEGLSYRLTGAQTGGGASTSEPLDFTIDTPGVTTIEVTATDVNGNSATRSYGVGVDLGDPTVTFGGTAANGQTIRRGDVRQLTFSCADATTAATSCQARIGEEAFTSGAAVPTASNGTYTVTVTAIDAVGRSTQQPFTYTVVDPLLQVTGNPSISGNPSSARVGDTLIATGATFSPAATLVAYHWKVEGRGFTVLGPTYEVRPEDVGKRISVFAEGFRDDYVRATTGTVGSVLAVTGEIRVTGQPTVRGPAHEGRLLQVDAPDEVLPRPQVIRTLWSIDGTVVETDAPRLLLGASHVGRRITCEQRFSKPGFTEARIPCRFAGGAVSVTVTGDAWAVRRPTTVRGKAKVGRVLRAVPPKLSGVARSHSYQWLRNGKPIRGATGSTYKLRRSDAKRRIKVRVTASTPHRPDVVSVSAAKRVRRP